MIPRDFKDYLNNRLVKAGLDTLLGRFEADASDDFGVKRLLVKLRNVTEDFPSVLFPVWGDGGDWDVKYWSALGYKNGGPDERDLARELERPENSKYAPAYSVAERSAVKAVIALMSRAIHPYGNTERVAGFVKAVLEGEPEDKRRQTALVLMKVDTDGAASPPRVEEVAFLSLMRREKEKADNPYRREGDSVVPFWWWREEETVFHHEGLEEGFRERVLPDFPVKIDIGEGMSPRYLVVQPVPPEGLSTTKGVCRVVVKDPDQAIACVKEVRHFLAPEG